MVALRLLLLSCSRCGAQARGNNTCGIANAASSAILTPKLTPLGPSKLRPILPPHSAPGAAARRFGDFGADVIAAE